MAESDMKAIDLDGYAKVSAKDRKKAYRAEIKEIKEHYNPKKYRKHSKHADWKTDWKGYVEYTHPWDGSSILETIVYRLEILRACIRHYSHHIGSDREIMELTEAIDLGRKILEYDYAQEANDFAEEHCSHVIGIYQNLGDSKKYVYGPKLGEIVQHRVKNSEDYFGDKLVKAWCIENGYDYKTVIISTAGRWDCHANHDVWLDMLSSTEVKRNEDKKKFFDILADKLESWWD